LQAKKRHEVTKGYSQQHNQNCHAPGRSSKASIKVPQNPNCFLSPPKRKTLRRKSACSLKKCDTATTTTIRLRLQLRFTAKPLAKYPPASSNAHDNLLIPHEQETKPENHHRLTTHPQILRKKNHKQELLLLQRDKKNSTKLCNNKSLRIGKAEKTPRPRPQVQHLQRMEQTGEEEQKKDKWEKRRRCSDWNEEGGVVF
jgi:hypothetical protein